MAPRAQSLAIAKPYEILKLVIFYFSLVSLRGDIFSMRSYIITVLSTRAGAKLGLDYSFGPVDVPKTP